MLHDGSLPPPLRHQSNPEQHASLTTAASSADESKQCLRHDLVSTPKPDVPRPGFAELRWSQAKTHRRPDVNVHPPPPPISL